MKFYGDEESLEEHVETIYGKLARKELTRLEKILDRYFSGEKISPSYPLDISGTEFQRRVWEATKKIGYGEVRTYKWVACRVGNCRAHRPVGNALASNPVVLVIPCHRVIKSDGTVGGYSGFEWIKLKLLELEGVSPRKLGKVPHDS